MSAKHTLMIVEPGIRLWGSERALAATLKDLTETWSRVVLVTPSGAELAEEVRGDLQSYGPVEVVHAPIGNLHRLGRWAQLRAMLSLAWLAVKLRPDRIYLNQAGLARVVLFAARLTGVPLALHLRIKEDIPRVTALGGTARTPLDVIFISDAMYNLAGRAPSAGRVRWIKAYDPYALSPLPAPLDEQAPLVCVGRLSHGKGMHLIVEALALDELAGTRADIYGAGVEGDAYASRLEAQAKKLEGNVRLMGFRHDVKGQLPAYRFLISTSRYEALGRVVMEAWEAGLLPIVYADSGGAAEMVRKSGGGLFFEDWTAASVARAVREALDMPETERCARVEAGRAWMAEALGLGTYRKALAGVLF